MNERGKAVLKAISEFHRVKGYSPTVRELCGLVGLRSTATVHKYLARLREEGYIASVPDRPRTLRIVEKSKIGIP